MSQPITNLPVGAIIKIAETFEGTYASRPWVILATGATNPYGNDKVFVIRKEVPALPKITWGVGVTRYDQSLLDSHFANEWRNRFSAETLACIAQSTVVCYEESASETYTIGRQFFAPTPHELGGENQYTNDPTQKLADIGVASANIDGGLSIADNMAPHYRTRLFSSQQAKAIYFNNRYKFNAGSQGSSSAEIYLRPCCNILSTALVSDEPDEDGYYALIPDPDNPYLYVRFHCSLGTVDDMPLKVRVDLTTEGNPEITSLQVCNNYGDETPTWENMTVGEKHTFTNTTKTSDNWEIGVKVEARGENTIRVYEPFAIVQTEVDE